MPQTMRKLTRHQPLVIVASGDSITSGNQTSGTANVPPYMPTWPELFIRRLKTRYGHEGIRFYNTAVGGTGSTWGLENADNNITSLDPDLVLIAFGMNDYWSQPVEEYRKNIQGMIAKVRARHPNTEFVLISSMQYDPTYTTDPARRSRLLGYATALKSLTGPGVCLLDMTTITGALYAAKTPKDFLSDPLHPNDFLARWYAQGLVSLFDPEQTSPRPATVPHSRSR
ncbi:MAG: SGNH/GDSL hydrolase family protein [Cytophagales bacterium]|nr:SGNH/GDSL hydrolase family protein [Armatimonadota bacterium]